MQTPNTQANTAPRTVFKVAPFGVYRINPATGEREATAVQLTQVLPDRELALLPKDPTAPHYGAAIQQEIAKLRAGNSFWSPLA